MNRPRSCQIITLWGTGNDDSQKDLCEVLAKYNNVSNCMKNWNALVPSFWMHIMVCQAAVLNRPSATTFHSVCVHCLNSIKKRKRPNFEQCMLCLWNACPTYLPPTCALLLHLSVCLSVCLPSSLSPPLMNACVCVCVCGCAPFPPASTSCLTATMASGVAATVSEQLCFTKLLGVSAHRLEKLHFTKLLNWS